MQNPYTGQQIERRWSQNPAERTVLYYAYLLTKAQSNSIRDDLKKVVTLEPGVDFDQLIHSYEYFNIMEDRDTCRLSKDALKIVNNIFVRDFGTKDDLSFNGLSIYRASAKDRESAWVSKGINYLTERFKDVATAKREPHPRGQILSFTTDVYSPTLVFWFVNTERMTKASEIDTLRAQIDVIRSTRETQLLRGAHNVTSEQLIRGLTTIGIPAAPTYSESVARAAANAAIPQRLLGPINLEMLGCFLDKHEKCRKEHYQGILEFLDPHRGGQTGGIFDTGLMIEYLKQICTQQQKE